MKPKLLLSLALVLSGGVFGCSTPHLNAPAGQTNVLPLYVYWGVAYDGSTRRFLSARIHLEEEIIVGGDDYLELTGHVRQRGTNLSADLMGNTGQQSQFYRGNITLEKPFFAQGGAASGGAGPPYWFVVSTNLDYRAILERVNAVMGFTNSPFNHPIAIMPSPVVTDVPRQIDPGTGLPWGNLLVDPTTGLPMPAKHDRQQ